MFKKIIQYFRNNQKQDDNNVLAEVSIKIHKNQDKPSIDIFIDEYNEKCMQGLATIVTSIQNRACSMEVIKMITNNLQENEKAEFLVSFLIKLGTAAEIYSMETQALKNEEEAEEPCIKPSDMIQ